MSGTYSVDVESGQQAESWPIDILVLISCSTWKPWWYLGSRANLPMNYISLGYIPFWERKQHKEANLDIRKFLSNNSVETDSAPLLVWNEDTMD